MQRFFDEPRIHDEAFFGFDWEFALTDSTDFPCANTAWRPVQLPHDWSVEYPVEEAASSCGSGGYVRTGIGWYRRDFSVNLLKESRYAVRFDGVYMNCDVWLNGQYVGGHVYGYTGFELELTALREGRNELLVRVNNSRQPGSRWYSGSGITRSVYLLRTGLTRLRPGGLFITTPEITDKAAKIRIKAEVLGAGVQDGLTLETTLLDPKGAVCAAFCCPVAGGAALQETEISHPMRWDIDTPHLYTAVTRLMLNGQPIDELTTRFGIRQIAYSSDLGFLLNGRKVILQGVCLHHDGGCVGAAVPPAIWVRRLKKLKNMGCNAIRCSHNPPDPALLDLADEMGFAVMDEAFDEWHCLKQKVYGSNTHSSRGYSEWFDACGTADITAMIERDRNHPSIVMWSIGNEVPEQSIPGGWEYAKQLAGLCHGLDPTRLITQACDQMKAEPLPATEEFLSELDIVGVNYVDRWRDRTETFFDEEKREHPEWIFLGTEDIAVNGPRCDYDLAYKGDAWGPHTYYANMLKAEKLWKYFRTRPFVVGSFIWTGVDYLGESSWPGKASSAGVIDTCGFEKDGYHFYRSQWVQDEPVLHLLPHLNLNLAPGQIYPLICYTNCASVELFVNGVSWGIKAYEFPNQGMTQYWGHFDRPYAPVTTNDLHLSWDIPYTQGEIIAVGRDVNGKEIARKVLRPAGQPAVLSVTLDRDALSADGRDVVQAEITLLDEQGSLVPHCDLTVSLHVDGGDLLGMDNGDIEDHESYRSGSRKTFGGLAYAIVRAPRKEGMMTLTFTAPGLAPVVLTLLCK